jgi:hypothetical protein
MRKRFSPKRRLALMGLFVVAAAAVVGGPAASAVTGAVSTTDNPGYADTQGNPLPYTDQACLNGQGINCNIYLDKRDVWMSGLPISARLGAGTYFFSVQVPGGQPTPNDGGAKNLSDTTVDPWSTGDTNADGSAIPSGDAAIQREFSIAGDGTITNLGDHAFDSGLLQLFPYDDTTNPGGVYILAVCKISDSENTSAVSVPTVAAHDCKYDAFKVMQGNGGPPPVTPPASAPTVSKDADGAYDTTFSWDASKSVDKTLVKQIGGTATFNYTVSVTHPNPPSNSNITVSGTIQAFNGNLDNQSNVVPVTVDITDQLSDGTTCDVTGGAGAVLSDAETDFSYTCSLSALPQGELDNTVYISWDAQDLNLSGDVNNLSHLDAGSDNFTFSSIDFTQSLIDDCATFTDTFGLHGTTGTQNTLGTVCQDGSTSSLGTGVTWDSTNSAFKYSRTVNVPAHDCQTYDNTANFGTDTSGSTDPTTGDNSQSVTVCGPANNSALTIGFWRNTNGQNLIGTYCNLAYRPDLATYLSHLATWSLSNWQNSTLGAANGPFSDAAGKTCPNLKTYVSGVLKGATATNMNVMLRAQMLATALDVYFSDPSLGYTSTVKSSIKPPSNFLTHGSLGGVSIDTTSICPMVDNTNTGTATCTSGKPSTNGFTSGAFPSGCMTVQGILTYESGNPPFIGSPSAPVWYGTTTAARTLQTIVKNTYDQINNNDAFGC